MLEDFNTQLTKDLDDVFLKEFSNKAVFKSSTSIVDVNIQFFEENLERLETSYHQVWGKYSDFSYVRKNDILLVNSIEYGVVDYSHDEFKDTTLLFIQKV